VIISNYAREIEKKNNQTKLMAKRKSSFSIIYCRITLNALNIDAALECELDIPLIICNTSKT